MKILLVFLVLLSTFTIAIVQAGGVPAKSKDSKQDNSIHQWACTSCFRRIYNTAFNKYYFKGANFNKAGNFINNNDVIKTGNINIINVDGDNEDKDGLNLDKLFAAGLWKAVNQNPTQARSPTYAFRPTYYNYRRFPTFHNYHFPYKYNFIARPRYGLGYTNFHGYGGYANPFLFSHLGYGVSNFPYNYNFMARSPFNPGFTGFNFPYRK